MARQNYMQQVQVFVPRQTAWEPILAEHLMSRLFAISGTSTLRIESHPKGLIWSISVQAPQVQTLIQTIYTLYPNATVKEAAIKPAVGYQLFQFQMAAPFVMPLMYVQDYNRQIDPTNLLLSALSRRQKRAHYIFECRLVPVSQKQIAAGKNMLKKSDTNWTQFITLGGAVQATLAKLTGENKSDRFEARLQRLLEGKLNAPLRAVRLAFKVKDNSVSIRSFIELLKPALAVFNRPGINMLVPASTKGSYPLILSPSELAAIWHLPNEVCTQADVAWSAGRVSPVLFTSSVFNDVLIGANKYQGKATPVGIAYKDRDTHVNLIGKTGTGKTTLIHTMVRQDIAHGRGLAVIDPHGDLVRNILNCSIPPERLDDVILFSIRDYDYPIGLNLLAAPHQLSSEIATSHALAVLRKLFEDQWSATRMEDALFAALLTLQSVPSSTIQDIPRLFADGQFRQKALSNVTNPVALEFWVDEFEAYSLGQQQQIAQPINNRIRKLYRDKTIQRIVCQTSCLDFTEIMNKGKIFLADLWDPSELNSEILSTIMVSKIQMAAMSRANIPPNMRRPFYLYIDELQNFTGSSLPTILSEARKYGLCLTMGNQFFHQLAGKTLEALQGNIGTTVIFRVGRKDARAIMPFVLPQFNEQDLVKLNKYNAIVNMQRGRQTIPAFNLETFPPPSPLNNAKEIVEIIRQRSRAQFGRPKEEVDATLVHRYRHMTQNHSNGETGNFLD